MEGLIPFVYRAITQYKNGNEGPLGSWLSESPSASYMRLPTGDSGRFQASDILIFGSDYGFPTSVTATTTTTTSTASSNMNSTSTNQILVSTGAQSPLCRLTPPRVAT